MNHSGHSRRPLTALVLCLAAAGSVLLLLRAPRGSASGFCELARFSLHPGGMDCVQAGPAGLVTASSGGWRYLDREGRLLGESSSLMDEPICRSFESGSLVFDLGRPELTVIDPHGASASLSLDGGIRGAHMNRQGRLAVITDKTGYLGQVTVYSRTLSPVFQWNAGSGRPVCARLSPKGLLAVLSLRESGFALHIFSTDESEPILEYSQEEGYPLDMAFLDDSALAVLTDSALLLADSGRGVRVCDRWETGLPSALAAGNGVAAVAFSPAPPGNGTELVLYSRKGLQISSSRWEEPLLSLSLYGKNLLLLFPGELVLCSRSMDPRAVWAVEDSALRAFFCGDSTAFLVSSDHGSVINLGLK